MRYEEIDGIPLNVSYVSLVNLEGREKINLPKDKTLEEYPEDCFDPRNQDGRKNKDTMFRYNK